MDFKCLNNDINLHYYPHINYKLILFIDHPYYMIIFLLLEMYLSDFEIPYNFENNYILIYDFDDDLEDFLKILSMILSNLLNYYDLELDIYNEIVNYLKNIRYYELIKLMFPNYNYIFDCKTLNYDIVKKSIKYFFTNSQIYFITSNKKIFNSIHFKYISKFIKKTSNLNFNIIPYKKYSSIEGDDNILGVYLNELEYYDHYVLDLLVLLLENKHYNCEKIWISKNYKILIIPYLCLSTLDIFTKKIKEKNFEIDVDLERIIKNKNFIDIIKYKNFNINIYNQITKDDIVKLSDNIFKQDNIKCLKNS
jgi:hypothetical protein